MLLQLGYKASTSLQDQLDKVRAKFTCTYAYPVRISEWWAHPIPGFLTLSNVLTTVKVEVNGLGFSPKAVLCIFKGRFSRYKITSVCGVKMKY